MRPLHVAAIRENDDETQGLDITYQAYAEAGLSLELRRHLGRRHSCLGCRRHLFHAAHPSGALQCLYLLATTPPPFASKIFLP